MNKKFLVVIAGLIGAGVTGAIASMCYDLGKSVGEIETAIKIYEMVDGLRTESKK